MRYDEIFARRFRRRDRRKRQIERKQGARDLFARIEQNAAVVVPAVRFYIVIAHLFGIQRVDALIHFA